MGKVQRLLPPGHAPFAGIVFNSAENGLGYLRVKIGARGRLASSHDCLRGFREGLVVLEKLLALYFPPLPCPEPGRPLALSAVGSENEGLSAREAIC